MINFFHHLAMDIAEKAMLSKIRGQLDDYQKLINEAFFYEEIAAVFIQDNIANEPSRSILFRSAASLAVLCHDIQKAKELANEGLRGNPPAELKVELLEILEKEYS